MKYSHIAGNPANAKKVFIKIGLSPFFITAAIYLFILDPIVLFIGGVISGTLLLIFGLASLMMRGAVRRFNENMQKIENKDYLTKWQYSPSEWQKFTEEELERRKGIPKATIMIVGIASIVVFFILFLSGGPRNDNVQIALIFMGIMVLIATLLSLFANHRRKIWVRNAIENRHGNDCAYIDTDFLLRGGEYFGFRDFGISLAKITKKDNHLIFTIRTQTQHGHADNDAWVLIPKNCDAEAEEIVNILASKKR